MKYLREFIIGSSILVIVPFYYLVYNSKLYNYNNYYKYTLLAPIWFGIFNIISLIISEKFNLSKRLRYFNISIISLLSIYFISQYYYNFNKKEWFKYYFIQFILYMFTWNILIFNLDKYIK